MHDSQAPASDADAYNEAGRAALADGDPDGALALFARAILAAPGDAHAHVNMAAAHLSLRRPDAARSHAQRAIQLAPDLPEAQHNLGNALFALGDAAGALAAFAAARALDPDSDAHWTNYLFAQAFAETVAPAAMRAENRAWGERLERRIGPVAAPLARPGFPGRKLRIAYVVPELDQHVTPRFVAPLLAAHDRARFDLSLYAHRYAGGPLPLSLRLDGVRWIDTYGQGAAAIAERMRAVGIDVLIHPCTFKARYRTVLAHRAAPLQIAGINFVSTTGLAATDILLGDSIVTPERSAGTEFVERIVQLRSFNCYEAPNEAPPVAPLPALRNGFVRFASFSNPAKLGLSALDLWAEVLRRTPASKLLLKHRAFDDAGPCRRIEDHFTAAGIASERIEFSGFTADRATYLAQYNEVDIALDSIPFNGGTTSYEAIWMGVPVLTLAGDRAMARQTASLMSALGRSDFVSDSKESFVNKAFQLAQGVEELAEIRAGLRAAALDSIFDAAKFTRGLEEVICALWPEITARGRGVQG